MVGLSWDVDCVGSCSLGGGVGGSLLRREGPRSSRDGECPLIASFMNSRSQNSLTEMNAILLYIPAYLFYGLLSFKDVIIHSTRERQVSISSTSARIQESSSQQDFYLLL